MTSTLSPRWLASRSARTLPAKPAPTTSQSNMDGRSVAIGERCGRNGDFLLHEIVHGRPGRVPRETAEMTVHPVQPFGLRPGEQTLGFRHHVRRGRGDLD